MAKINVTCWKGPDPATDCRTFSLEADMVLRDVRGSLTREGFMSPDTDAYVHRFVDRETESEEGGNPIINPDDAVLSLGSEKFFPLGKVLRTGNRLIITNTKRKVPDIMGIRSDWLFSRNRNLGVQVWLNNGDPEARAINERIQARNPLMFAECKRTDGKVFPYQRICVVINQSVVGLTLSSWGGAGYEMQIESYGTSSEWICDGGLYIPRSEPGRSACGLSRYASQAKTIQIRSAADTQISGSDAVTNFQRVTVRTRRMTAWKADGGKSYRNNDPVPPSLPAFGSQSRALGETLAGREKGLANAGRAANIGVIPGGSIIPGGPTLGPPSSQQFGSIYDVECDRDWSNPIGEVEIFFFVFKTLEAAKVVIDGYNGFDPDQWANG